MDSDSDIVALVAEKVLGWRVQRMPQAAPQDKGPLLQIYGNDDCRLCRNGLFTEPWNPMTDLNAAGEILGMFEEWNIEGKAEVGQHCRNIRIVDIWVGDKVHSATGYDLARVICFAALDAKGVTLPRTDGE